MNIIETGIKELETQVAELKLMVEKNETSNTAALAAEGKALLTELVTIVEKHGISPASKKAGKAYSAWIAVKENATAVKIASNKITIANFEKTIALKAHLKVISPRHMPAGMLNPAGFSPDSNVVIKASIFDNA